VKINPSASFSILASEDTIAFKAGSFSTTEPAEGGGGGVAGAAGGGAGCEQNTDARQEANKSPCASRRFMKRSPLLWGELKSRTHDIKREFETQGQK
jgi:hypothetical protein